MSHNYDSTNNPKQLIVLGAVFGDIIGSLYEGSGIKDINFSPLVHPRCHFTDDTVCTIAIADALISNISFTNSLKSWCRKYPRAGYGWGLGNGLVLTMILLRIVLVMGRL